MARIAYLGPEGTFSEAALIKMTAAGLVPGGGTQRALPTDSTPAALDAVRDGDADYACVPIENSIDGTVLPTLDNLASGSPLQVFAELTLDVAFSIVVAPGTAAADVRTVAAFPGGRGAGPPVAGRAPGRRRVVPTISNAAAAQDVRPAVPTRGSARRWPRSATGLSTLADGVVDEANAPHPVRPRRSARAATGPHRCRPHVGGAADGQCAGRARRRTLRVRYPRHRPDTDRVPAHPGRAGYLRVLPGLCRPHRRHRGGRGTQGAAPTL